MAIGEVFVDADGTFLADVAGGGVPALWAETPVSRV